MLGPLRVNEKEIRKRINFEIVEELDDEDVVYYIKIIRIKWLGHV